MVTAQEIRELVKRLRLDRSANSPETLRVAYDAAIVQLDELAIQIKSHEPIHR
jgi:hypothetical protein